MKKKSIIMGIIIVSATILGICLLINPKVLGNMNYSHLEPITATSDISFSGEAGDRIKFSLRANVKSGDLDISLYDSKGNKVYQLDRAKALEIFFDLSNTDTYTLVAEYSDFVGSFKVKAYKAN